MEPIAVADFAEMTPAAVRFAESRYLFARFVEAGRAEDHDLFLMTVFFDSFLFCFVSVEEMVGPQSKDLIQAIPAFRFLKALRNISTHHSVLSGVKGGKFPRIVARHVYASNCGSSDSSRFFIICDRLNVVFDEILKVRPGEKRTIDPARDFLANLAGDEPRVYVVGIVEEAIHQVSEHVG